MSESNVQQETNNKPKKYMQMYESYKFAFSRINLALREQFPLEAIAIEESIIYDRLFSLFANIKGVLSEKDNQLTLWHLIKKVTEQIGKEIQYQEVLDKLNSWRRKRNLLLHSIAKAKLGVPLILAEDFLPQAMEVAKEGKILAHEASKLKNTVISKIKKSQKNTLSS